MIKNHKNAKPESTQEDCPKGFEMHFSLRAQLVFEQDPAIPCKFIKNAYNELTALLHT